MRFSTNRPGAGLHAPLLRPEFVSLPYFSADTPTDRNNSSSTIFRELEKELRSAFHISDRVCNAVQRPEGTGTEGEGGGEKKGEKEEGEARNKKSLKTGYFCPEREMERKPTDRLLASRSSIRLIFYLG